MSTRLDAERWGDLEIVEVTPVDLRAARLPAEASWWCGRCGDEHLLANGSVVKLRSHLGITDQIACRRCAVIARRRATGQRPRRVLLVDDDADYRDLLRRLLEEDGSAEVIGYVADGHDALVEIDRLHPDVVILDLAMPRLDGLELLQHLSSDVEAIVLTGQLRMRERCRRLHRGVTVLPKGRRSIAQLTDLLTRPA